MGWQSNILIPRVGRGQFGLGWTLQTLAKSGLVSTETLILSFFTRLVWNFQVCYVFRRLFLPAKRLSVNIGSRQSKARINIATPHHSIKQVQSPPPCNESCLAVASFRGQAVQEWPPAGPCPPVGPGSLALAQRTILFESGSVPKSSGPVASRRIKKKCTFDASKKFFCCFFCLFFNGDLAL